MTLYLDPFGIGAAQFMALDLFENASRASGRTILLARSVFPGDAIVVPTTRLVDLYKLALRDAGQKPTQGYNGHTKHTVAILYADPKKGRSGMRGTNPFGHTYFSHEYVIERYRHALQTAAAELVTIEKAMSKDGLPFAAYIPGARINETAYGKHPL